MTSPRIVSFVLSGGIGSRLWPLSREDYPKQFHTLSGQESMLAKTLRRLKARSEGETPVFLIASERHADRARADLHMIDVAGGRAIFEPVGRNTAAAIAIATLETLATFGDELVLVVPSDHEITPEAKFWSAVETGAVAAAQGRIVVFGIKPSRPETGYGYIKAAGGSDGVFDVARFVEKPDAATAKDYLADGSYYWNAGIFLFRASSMRDAFLELQPELWAAAKAAFDASTTNIAGRFLPADLYASIMSDSIDYAIMENRRDIAMVPAQFEWNDLGSWQSLLQIGPSDEHGNVMRGDVVAIDCENSYFRSEGRLLSVVGMNGLAVVATPDATFVAPIEKSQNVKHVVERLEKSGRLETRYTPSQGRPLEPGAMNERVRHWLFEKALPIWSSAGVDENFGGFHEALDFQCRPVARPKRVRTIARQIYAFAAAKSFGWDGPVDALIDHGIEFLLQRARSERGGWVRALNGDGSLADPAEDTYDHSCVLLALAHAHRCGNLRARALADETFTFVDAHLTDRQGGFLETTGGEMPRRSNPHMHMLEAFLAWHEVTGEAAYLHRAAGAIELFRSRFFDPDSWTLGEYFTDSFERAEGEAGEWTEPGHHFEWCALLIDYAERSGERDLYAHARKLYASAIANGLNRSTGLAYGAVSRDAIPLDRMSRSWPQCEAIKAAIALDRTHGPDMKPEIEKRVTTLFRWHLDSAPDGLWIDRIDEQGNSRSTDVPASILYHLTTAFKAYFDATSND